MRAVLCGVLILVAMLGVPFQFFWQTVYDGLRLYAIWPLVIPLVALYFTAIGFSAHHNTGLPQFCRGLAWVTAVMLLALTAILLVDTAPDWSFEWSIGFLAIATLSVVVAVPGFVGYTESWRRRHNSSIVDRVRDRLVDGSFHDWAKREIAKPPDRRAWASPHCFRIIEGNYQEAKMRTMLWNEGKVNLDQLEPYFEAGENLRLYLSLKWSEQVMTAETRLWLQLDLLRELLTIGLASRPQRNRQKQEQIEGWVSQLNGTEIAPYREMLTFIFELGYADRRSHSPENSVRSIHKALSLYGNLPLDIPNRVGGGTIDLHEICARTWLALAHYALPNQACFDVWMEMRRAQGKDVLVSPDQDGEYDPAKTLSRRFLADWYAEWSNLVPEDWNAGLSGIAAHAQRQLSQPADGPRLT